MHVCGGLYQSPVGPGTVHMDATCETQTVCDCPILAACVC